MQIKLGKHGTSIEQSINNTLGKLNTMNIHEHPETKKHETYMKTREAWTNMKQHETH